MYILINVTITKCGKTIKREISNRRESDLDKFNSSDNRNYQESGMNKQRYSLSHISCSFLILE